MTTPTAAIREEGGALVFDFGAGISIEARRVVRTRLGVRAEIRVLDLGLDAGPVVGLATVALDNVRERREFLATIVNRDGRVPDWDARLLLIVEHLSRHADEMEAPSAGVRANSVTVRPVRWLWPNRIPAARVNIFGGDPDVGKSMLTDDLAARISVGGHWPDGGLAPRGRVLMLTAEDNLEDTVVPRLQRHGADLARVHLIGPQDIMGYILPDGILPLEERIKELQDAAGDTVLVTFDPLEVFIGPGVDTYKSAEVRGAIAPLEAVAERTGATIVGICHLNKRSTETTPLYRFGASLAFVAAARSALLVAYDPEDDAELQHERLRVFVSVKGNLGPKQSALAYSIVDPGVIKWEGTIDRTAYQLLAPPSNNKKGQAPALVEAESFLNVVLADGPMLVNDIDDEARAAGISVRTLRRAKEELGVEAVRDGKEGERGGGAWSWKLRDPVCGHWPEGIAVRFLEFLQKDGREVSICICCGGPAPNPPPEHGGCSVCRDGAPWKVNRIKRWATGQPKDWG